MSSQNKVNTNVQRKIQICQLIEGYNLPDIKSKPRRNSRIKTRRVKNSDKEPCTIRVFSPQNDRSHKMCLQNLASNALSPKPQAKRRSLQDKIEPLTKEQEACVDLHVRLIAKSRQRVIEAKESRFKGFFSPRLLRNKVHKFTVSRINSTLKRDFSSKEEFKAYIQNFVPKDSVEAYTKNVCTMKRNCLPKAGGQE